MIPKTEIWDACNQNCLIYLLGSGRGGVGNFARLHAKKSSTPLEDVHGKSSTPLPRASEIKFIPPSSQESMYRIRTIALQISSFYIYSQLYFEIIDPMYNCVRCIPKAISPNLHCTQKNLSSLQLNKPGVFISTGV